MDYKFNIGDEVKIVRSGFGCESDEIGKTTKIARVGSYNDGPGYEINPPYGNSLGSSLGSSYYDRMCSEKSFELVKSADSLNYKFKLGDEVTISQNGYGFGLYDVGKVTKIVELGVYCKEAGYKVDLPYGSGTSDRAQYKYMCGEKSFKLIKSADSYKFKIGDKVRITQSGSGCYCDDIGKVSFIAGYGKYCGEPGYLIDPPLSGNAQTGNYNGMAGEKSFELVESLQEATAFEVGDWVEIVNLTGKNGNELGGIIGHKGKITQIDNYEPKYSWFHLEPTCTGGCWQVQNLQKIPDPRVRGERYHVDMSIQASRESMERYAMATRIGEGIIVGNPCRPPIIDYPEFLIDPRPKIDKEVKPVFISVPKI
jgi:hypothetical protein